MAGVSPSLFHMASDDGRVLPDQPVYRPLERFWPYADLPEQPTAAELANLHPELRSVLFGAPALPFSISIDFPKFDGPDYPRAVELARASDEYIEVTVNGEVRHRARFYPADRPLRLRDLYEVVGTHVIDECLVLVDDQPVPYAKQLWLPLVWFLIR
jgi:hypothetical protein